MKNIEYFSPQKNHESKDFQGHSFDLIIEGETIGSAEVEYFSKPLPLYQLSDIYVDFKQKGRGYASQILDQVELWLKERGKPGVLVEAILDGDPAQGMYQKRGWQEVPESAGMYVFNWPKKIDLSILKGYPFRYTDHSLRR